MKTIALILDALLILVAILLLADKNGNFYRSLLSSKSDPDAYHEKRYKTVAIPTLLICSLLIIIGVFTHGFKFHEILGTIFLTVFFIYLILAATWCKNSGYIKKTGQENPAYRAKMKSKRIINLSFAVFIFIIACITGFFFYKLDKWAIIGLILIALIAIAAELILIQKTNKTKDEQ